MPTVVPTYTDPAGADKFAQSLLQMAQYKSGREREQNADFRDNAIAALNMKLKVREAELLDARESRFAAGQDAEIGLAERRMDMAEQPMLRAQYESLEQMGGAAEATKVMRIASRMEGPDRDMFLTEAQARIENRARMQTYSQLGQRMQEVFAPPTDAQGQPVGDLDPVMQQAQEQYAQELQDPNTSLQRMREIRSELDGIQVRQTFIAQDASERMRMGQGFVETAMSDLGGFLGNKAPALAALGQGVMNGSFGRRWDEELQAMVTDPEAVNKLYAEILTSKDGGRSALMGDIGYADGQDELESWERYSQGQRQNRAVPGGFFGDTAAAMRGAMGAAQGGAGAQQGASVDLGIPGVDSSRLDAIADRRSAGNKPVDRGGSGGGSKGVGGTIIDAATWSPLKNLLDVAINAASPEEQKALEKAKAIMQKRVAASAEEGNYAPAPALPPGRYQ